MQRSQELQSVLTSLIDTWGKEDMWPSFDNAMCTDDGTLFVGSDPAEWWDDQREMRRVMEAQSAELQGSRAMVKRVDAWSEGTVGWGAADMYISFPGVPGTANARLTVTLSRRPAGWKIVQGHLSVGVPNEELFKHLTV